VRRDPRGWRRRLRRLRRLRAAEATLSEAGGGRRDAMGETVAVHCSRSTLNTKAAFVKCDARGHSERRRQASPFPSPRPTRQSCHNARPTRPPRRPPLRLGVISSSALDPFKSSFVFSGLPHPRSRPATSVVAATTAPLPRVSPVSWVAASRAAEKRPRPSPRPLTQRCALYSRRVADPTIFARARPHHVAGGSSDVDAALGAFLPGFPGYRIALRGR